ncbi:HNH endonuclease [Shewanella sp. 10N.286.45.A1]|uniref:hypothetical protein n=1 Tax=Shewanella sp. 10N.286.45.A1 TaxID=3229694 RepID=UPI00354CC25A
MRKVVRAEVPYPERLQNLTDKNHEQLLNHNNISNSVYGHVDVKASLMQLYFEKCYICEESVSAGMFDVEHYLPKRHFPQLGYTWSNLHKSCEVCNLAKENKTFHIRNNDSEFADIKLLDPSSEEYNVYNYMRFNIDADAELAGIGNDPIVVQKAEHTIKYLNGELDTERARDLPHRRSKRVMAFMRYCAIDLASKKERIREIKLNLDTYSKPREPLQEEEDSEICMKLIGADHQFLSDKAPFSTCTRAQLQAIFGVSYSVLLQIKEKMRQELDL